MLACRLPPPAYSPRPKTGHLSAKGTERPDTTSPRIERIGQFWGECITQIGSFQWLSKYFQSPEKGPAASWAPPGPGCPVLLVSASVYLVPSHSADCYSKCSRISTTDSFTFVRCGFHAGQIPRDLLEQAVGILPVRGRRHGKDGD